MILLAKKERLLTRRIRHWRRRRRDRPLILGALLVELARRHPAPGETCIQPDGAGGAAPAPSGETISG
ncbi:MAG TPA: hypothetical protein VIR33_15055 [Thermopolyspora sp.]